MEDEQTTERFIKASIGWIRYKPLLVYITNNENYRKVIKDNHEKLLRSVPEINKLFEDNVFDLLISDLEQYDKNVKKHYNEFISTNEVWNKLKKI